MSQRKDTTVLILALLTTLGLVGGGIFWLKDQIFPSDEQISQPSSTTTRKSSSPSISFGNTSLVPGQASDAKTQGIEALAKGYYQQAVSKLEIALQSKPNDPEALIFLHNARIGNQKNYTIAASVPLSTDPNGSLEILRGIAQAQKEINSQGGINGIPLRVGIANDDNNPEMAKKVAAKLVKNTEVLGVVGPYASGVTLAASSVYNDGKLVVISPISTSVKISNLSPYVFRTVPSDFIAARALANYMIDKLEQKQAAVFFNSQSDYSKSLKSEFVSAISLQGGQVVNEFDLSKSDFSASKSLAAATKRGVEVLMLAPNTATLDKALQVVQLNQKRLPLLAGDDVYSLKTLEVGQQQAEGMIVAIPWHIDSQTNPEFIRNSRQLWSADVNWRTALAYDATQALIAALSRNPSRTGVRKALAASDFSIMGASGTVRFLPSGDRNAQVELVTIEQKEPSRSRTGYDFVPVAK
ncbi:MAG: ABC transporter substrate-binding protein [Calothrix sp. MO_167.B12]|nr:ABC transporter substrate-binding protein [Calothrix sp. MO_167.B12]